MSTRLRISAGILAAICGLALSAGSLAGQQSTAKPAASGTTAKPQTATNTAKPGAPAAKAVYKAPRTPDGQVDLQGFWTNATLTPMERGDDVTTEYVTKEEFEKRIARRAATDEEQTKPGTTNDVHYDFTQFGLDKTQSPIALNYRTSMIIDPPDGKIPAIATAGGGAGRGGRGAAGAGAGTGGAAARGGGGTAAAIGGGGAVGGGAGRGGTDYSTVKNLPIGTRCIIMGGAGPPLMDAGYNANYQIVQGVGTVMIVTEMIHDVRIIPLDNRPAPPSGYRGWMGSSRGRWDGDTLVVETTNFNGRNPFRGAQGRPASTDQLKVTERFTRTGADQVTYRFTVEDPNTWSRPWTAEQVMQRIDGPIFEVACHEGNYGVANTLAGVRLEEKKAAEEAAKKGTK